MNSTIRPGSYEEWVEEARKDERFAYHDDRLKEALAKVALLETNNAELSKDDLELKKNRNFLLELLKNHKHDLQGATMFPSNIVNFQD
ncbi:MAG: hypothetical protein KAQ99_04350 [Candidatus Aureabacteria bacterium]|nr:hypothetical protein [Candidatus Auribacterota bacterium]